MVQTMILALPSTAFDFSFLSAPSASERGTGGQQMHAGAGPGDEQNLTPEGENNPQHLYAVRGQRTFCNKVNVAWQLTDTGPSDGGFVSPPSTTSTDHLSA